MTIDNPPDVPPEFPETPGLTFVKGRKFTLEDDFAPYLNGKVPLPNFKPLPVWRVAKMAARFYGRLVEDKKAIRAFSDYPNNCLYLLPVGQGGGLTGEGYVILSVGYRGDESDVIAGSFTLCEHEKVEGAGANHSRGWHPGYCKKCGLDMSVDSGD